MGCSTISQFGLPRGFYIGGEWIEPADASSDPILNPATEEAIGAVLAARKADVEDATASAREAFDSGCWCDIAPGARAAFLQRFHDAIAGSAERIKAMLVAETGATISVAGSLQFPSGMQCAQYYIDACVRVPLTATDSDISDLPSGRRILGAGVVSREPVGVVAAITPCNFPFSLNMSKVFAALAVGNTVILKPSELTPFSAMMIAAAAREAGLPKGVFNLVTGGGSIGQALTRDPNVDMVSFTGSDRTAAEIQRQLFPSIKKLSLEASGKSAMIVRSDADLRAAVRSGVTAVTQHAGQSCAATTRLLVHNSVRSEFVKLAHGMMRGIKVGDPANPEVQMGPLLREARRARVEEFVEQARESGATLVTGGSRPSEHGRGYFYAPTLFDDVDNASPLGQQEIFGPVAAVIGFDTDAEAVALANASPFGLAGSIFSADVGRTFEMARKIRTGRVAINGGSGSVSHRVPFGGVKQSGSGRRYGAEGLNEFTYSKTIAFHAC